MTRSPCSMALYSTVIRRALPCTRLLGLSSTRPGFHTTHSSEDKADDAFNKSSFKKYQLFVDENAPVILDVEEERRQTRTAAVTQEEDYPGISLERGVEGVFNTCDLVDLLRQEKAEDVFVVRLPAHLKYVNHIVVVTGKSQRHMTSLAETVRVVYKRKKHPSDLFVRIEGEDSKDWVALDLGNIALHIFSAQGRKKYDLESLWSVGAEYDTQCNKPDDPLVDLLEQHSVYLSELQKTETHG